jgi:hypothetical protein
MERDTVISHGMNEFLKESMMERADKYYLAICNHSGMISIYNPSKKLFMSPMMDGPIKYTGSLENDNMRIEHITQFGRSFSIISIPYSFKLLVQELQTINIQLRIVTEDNIDQVDSMSYSDNIKTVTQNDLMTPNLIMRAIYAKLYNNQYNNRQNLETPDQQFTPDEVIEYNKDDKVIYLKDTKPTREWVIKQILDDDNIGISTNDFENTGELEKSGSFLMKNDKRLSLAVSKDDIKHTSIPDSPAYNPDSPAYNPDSPPYAPDSPAYNPDSPPYAPDSPAYNPDSPPYAPDSPAYNPDTPPYPDDGQDKQSGAGGQNYQKGGRVCMRNTNDSYPKRPWEISHVGPKFITVKAVDESGLSESDRINVVSPHDIFPEDQIHIFKPELLRQEQLEMNRQSELQNNVPQQQQPTVIIAPKFFNGNGSDNSTAEQPPIGHSQPDTRAITNSVLEDTPPIVIKDVIQDIVQKDDGGAIDFSNIKIIKKGE